MSTKAQEIARKVLKKEWERLSERERRVIKHFLEHAQVSRNTNLLFEDERTCGQRLADRIAEFGGSWTFILIFLSLLLAWVALNSLILAKQGETFDPYPYILLNLFLSMIASLQAPIIMMSQNRQAQKDRLDAAQDYEVNLKAELEIRHLHEKLDELREQKWAELIEIQQEQIRMLTQLFDETFKQNQQSDIR